MRYGNIRSGFAGGQIIIRQLAEQRTRSRCHERGENL